MTTNACRQRRLAAFAIALLTFAGVNGARAEDIDLFTGLQTNAGTKPSVLLLLDNASTWNASTTIKGCDIPDVVSANNAGTDVGAIQCALYRAVNTLVTNPQLAGCLGISTTGSTTLDVFIFDRCFENYFWNYDNNGLKLLELRFYSAS